MRILSGEEQLGIFQNKEIIIDFDELFRYRGERLIKSQFPKQFARILFLLGVLSLALSIFLSIFEGSYLTFLLSLLLFILSFFSNFFWKRKNSRGHQEQIAIDSNKIIINYILSDEVLDLIDYCYFKNQLSFFGILTLNLLEDKEVSFLMSKRLGINLSKFKNNLKKSFEGKDLSFENNYKDFFNLLFHELNQNNLKIINSKFLLIVLCKTFLKESLKEYKVNELDIKGFGEWLKNQELITQLPKSTTSLKTGLNPYFTNISKEVLEGKIYLSLGRDEEFKKLDKALSQGSYPLVIVVGENGIGKSVFARSLATKILLKETNPKFFEFNVLALNLDFLMLQANSVDNFKDNIINLFKEIEQKSKIILIIDDIERMFELDTDFKLEFMHLITKVVHKADIKIIGTTRIKSFEEKIKINNEFKDLIYTLKITEVEESIILNIILDEVYKLEKEFKVRIEIEAIKELIKLSNRINSELQMPGKVISSLEVVTRKANEKGITFVDSNFILDTLKLSIYKNSYSESSQSFNLIEKKIKQRVIGQDRAIESILAILKQINYQEEKRSKPLASFLFNGVDGIGKTQLGLAISDSFYGDENLFLKMKIASNKTKQNWEEVINFVSKKPFCVIMLENIENLNQSEFEMINKILEEGKIEDFGKETDFTNTILIFSTEIANKLINQSLVLNKKFNEIEKLALIKVVNRFELSFINKLDKVITFNPLNFFEIEKIINSILTELNKTIIGKNNIEIKWNEETIKILSVEAKKIGVKKLKRNIEIAINEIIENQIGLKRLKEGDTLVFDGLNYKAI